MACSLEVKGESESNIGRIAPNLKEWPVDVAADQDRQKIKKMKRY